MPEIQYKRSQIKAEDLSATYSELCELVGIDAVIKIHDKYRGTQVFFPLELFCREFITQMIVSEFNGHNIRELATKYGYTEKWIRKIIKENTNK